MVSKCANPACSAPFHYLREGKLFEVDSRESSAVGERKPIRRVEFFWLCGRCSAVLTVINDKEKGVIIAPLSAPPVVAARRAAAS